MRLAELEKRHLLAICLFIAAGYLFVGLWPFNFFPGNNVAWHPSGRGLSFRPHSVIYSERPLELSGSAVTIELYLQSDSEAEDKTGSILSLFNGTLPEILSISRKNTRLILRLRGREVAVEAGFRPGVLRFIVLTSDAAGTSVYVDGALARAWPKLTLVPENLPGRLVLGNAPAGKRPWEGTLFGVAIYERALALEEIARHHRLWTSDRLEEFSTEPGLSSLYLLNEPSGRSIQDHSPSRTALLNPQQYRDLRRMVLQLPGKGRPNIPDIIVNIVGFAPFGFFYFTYRTRPLSGRAFRNAVTVVLLSAIISLTIELLQAYLPSRTSSFLDVLCNTRGALIAVLISSLTKKATHYADFTGSIS